MPNDRELISSADPKYFDRSLRPRRTIGTILDDFLGRISPSSRAAQPQQQQKQPEPPKLEYRDGMWRQGNRVRRGPSIRALKANLKNRGVDAVRDSLGNAYGPEGADDFIERATGYKATDPLLSQAVKNYKVQSSNPTMPAPYRPDFSSANRKAAAYEARLHRQRLLENAEKSPGIADDLFGLEALGPATRGLGKDLTATNIDSAYEKKVRPRVKMTGSGDVEFDPFTNDYTPSARSLQKKAFDDIEARYRAVRGVGATERQKSKEMINHRKAFDKMGNQRYLELFNDATKRKNFVGPPSPVGPEPLFRSEPDLFVGPPPPVGPPSPFSRGAGLKSYLDRLQSRKFGALEDFLSHGG